MAIKYRIRLPRTIIDCPKCGRKNAKMGRKKDIIFFKCECGHVIINELIGVENIKLNSSKDNIITQCQNQKQNSG